MNLSGRELEDVQLMGRVAAGDRDALAALFDRHSPVILGVLTRMLRQRSEAEEILQEALLQAWQEAGRYRPALATPRGWLLMLARSRALDRLRSNSARVRREEVVASGPLAVAAAEPSAPARLEAEERRRGVVEALAQLSPPQRECIELAFFDGLTHTQIAERLGQPLGTVKSRIVLGMNKLRQVLSPYA